MGCYLFSLVTIWLLWKQYEEYVQLRHNYLRMAQPSQYTVMVRSRQQGRKRQMVVLKEGCGLDYSSWRRVLGRYWMMAQVDHIPGAMRSNFSVATFFENLFPNCIKKVTIMLEAEELDSLWAKYKKNCEWLEWAQAVTADRSQLRCRSCRSQDRLLKKIQKMLDEKEVGLCPTLPWLLTCTCSPDFTCLWVAGLGGINPEDSKRIHRMALPPRARVKPFVSHCGHERHDTGCH